VLFFQPARAGKMGGNEKQKSATREDFFFFFCFFFVFFWDFGAAKTGGSGFSFFFRPRYIFTREWVGRRRGPNQQLARALPPPQSGNMIFCCASRTLAREGISGDERDTGRPRL